MKVCNMGQPLPQQESRYAMNDLPAQMVRNAWRHAEYSWFQPTPATGNNDEDTGSDNESLDNAADNADNEMEETTNPAVLGLFLGRGQC